MYRLYKYCYRYPRVDLRCYCVIFGYDGKTLKVLLKEREIDPYKGNWELPGGFLKLNDEYGQLEDGCPKNCVHRIIKRETSLSVEEAHLLDVCPEEPRNLMDGCMPVVYWTVLHMNQLPLSKLYEDDTREMWFNVTHLPDLSFSHHEYIEKALGKLKERAQYFPIGRQLMPEKFTLSELRALYEAMLQKPLDEQNFRRRILSFGHLDDIKERGINIFKRPARLFKFNSTYDLLLKEGLKKNF